MAPGTRAALHRLNIVAAAESIRQATEFLNDSVPGEAAIKRDLLVQMGRIAELPQGSRFMAYFAEEARCALAGSRLAPVRPSSCPTSPDP